MCWSRGRCGTQQGLDVSWFLVARVERDDWNNWNFGTFGTCVSLKRFERSIAIERLERLELATACESRLHGFLIDLQLSGFVLANTRIHQSHTRTQNLLADPRTFDSRLLFNLEEQRSKGIVNIPPVTDKIYFDTGFTVV